LEYFELWIGKIIFINYDLNFVERTDLPSFQKTTLEWIVSLFQTILCSYLNSDLFLQRKVIKLAAV
jgi:hypothetical protein